MTMRRKLKKDHPWKNFKIPPYYSNPDYLEYLEECQAICNRIYVCRNISLNEKGIIEELKKIDKLNNHKCFKD